MDIRFEEKGKRGEPPKTRLYAPVTDTDESTEPPRPKKKRSAARQDDGSLKVKKPETRAMSRIGLVFSGFLFAGMILFALTGYERIARAYADINALNTEIDTTNLRIIELEASIECAVTIQDAQQAAEQYGMRYPQQSQYVKIGDALPFSGQAPAATTDAPTQEPSAPTNGGGNGTNGDDTGDGGVQPPDGG